MNIVTWNVNGLLRLLAARRQTLGEVLDSIQADIVCMQETKLPKGRMSPELTFLDKYWAFYHFSANHIGMYGVATFCRKSTSTPISAWLGFPGEDYLASDQEGRVLVTDHGDFVLANVYFPTGTGYSQLTYKVWFQHVVQEMLETLLRDGKDVLIAGDLNFAHTENDHYNPTGSNTDTGVKEFARHRGRMWLTALVNPALDLCFDIYRLFHPDESGCYTFWKDEEKRQNNHGARIDYFLGTKKLAQRMATSCTIETTIKGSDHCPVRVQTNILQSTLPSEPPSSCAAISSEYEQDNSQRVLNDYFPVGKPRPVKAKKKDPATTPGYDTQEVSTNPVGFMCNHNEPAKITVVRKPGRNQGRPFYMCARPAGVPNDPEGRCDYFQWGDVANNGKMCECEQLARLAPVKKEGKNKGRLFYSCARKKGKSCKFFQWADEDK